MSLLLCFSHEKDVNSRSFRLWSKKQNHVKNMTCLLHCQTVQNWTQNHVKKTQLFCTTSDWSKTGLKIMWKTQFFGPFQTGQKSHEKLNYCDHFYRSKTLDEKSCEQHKIYKTITTFRLVQNWTQNHLKSATFLDHFLTCSKLDVKNMIFFLQGIVWYTLSSSL